MSADTARSVCEFLVTSIVEDPDAVRITESEVADGVVRFDVSVGDGDMGRVIGRRGRVAGAIRTVVRAAGARDGVDVEVEFVDD